MTGVDESKDAARARVMIATLQKYGYDLQDPAADTDGASLAPSSASILHLREPKNNQTAFHIAAKKGHVDVLKALAKLPRASDYINLGDRHANTALHFAASGTRDTAAEMVELLFSMGASFSAVNIRGQTPLAIHIMTAKEDQPYVTRLFVRKGLPVNDLTNGTTYLHMAIERGLVEIGGALVAGGASVNMPDQNGVMVSDTVPKKTLIKLITFMKEGTQAAPLDVARNACKICKNPRGRLETLKDCNLCGRPVCKTDSQKAADIKPAVVDKEPPKGRLCNVCCTVVMLRTKHTKSREGFNQMLYGCSMK
ncbi:TPA: hypothetical protein N0F65_012383 [Lagenidium giganteum]|uniref:Myosin-like protein n=1 Tax=Lagenidium giganteum TaxID=4803 RepID=A0AAV2YS89_9STRA|nr:TPA: hypothetical protein N0F65_012383 [Lagenidium giganteum]